MASNAKKLASKEKDLLTLQKMVSDESLTPDEKALNKEGIEMLEKEIAELKAEAPASGGEKVHKEKKAHKAKKEPSGEKKKRVSHKVKKAKSAKKEAAKKAEIKKEKSAKRARLEKEREEKKAAKKSVKKAKIKAIKHKAIAKVQVKKVETIVEKIGDDAESIKKYVDTHLNQIIEKADKLEATAKREILDKVNAHLEGLKKIKFEHGGGVGGGRTILQKIFQWGKKDEFKSGGGVGKSTGEHHPLVKLDTGFRLPKGYSVKKGADKKEDYSDGAKHIDITKPGIRLDKGYQVLKGADKHKKYDDGGKVVPPAAAPVATPPPAAVTTTTTVTPPSTPAVEKKAQGGAVNKKAPAGFTPKFGIFEDKGKAEAQAKSKNATIQVLPAKTVPAHVKKAHTKKGKLIPEKHVKERHFPVRYMVVAKT